MEDGFDYMGHARGGVQSRTVDSGCTCAFGKLKQQKPAIKKMCRNCKHCQGIYCQINWKSRIYPCPVTVGSYPRIYWKH